MIERVCQAGGVSPAEVAGSGRRTALCRAREGITYVWMEWLGHGGPPVAMALGIRPPAVYPIARRGRQQAERWQEVFKGEQK